LFLSNHSAIRDVFGTLDEDNSGTLDAAELETAMQHMEVDCSSGEIEELVKQIDEDGNLSWFDLIIRSCVHVC